MALGNLHLGVSVLNVIGQQFAGRLFVSVGIHIERKAIIFRNNK